MGLPGVFCAKKKDGTLYYRSSITHKGKHISLGSFKQEMEASAAYQSAHMILTSSFSISDIKQSDTQLSFEKIISLINFRDNGIYIKNPIYLHKRYFLYYLNELTPIKFDIEDLFYYSTHKIQKRGGYLFVADYGMQTNILNRYGIKNYAVLDKDYRHRNGDDFDFTYNNIEVINGYYGVSSITKDGTTRFRTQIHLNGNYLVGTYDTETDAAIAYNKAVDIVKKRGCPRSFQTNFILSLSASQYAKHYHQLAVSEKLLKLTF